MQLPRHSNTTHPKTLKHNSMYNILSNKLSVIEINKLHKNLLKLLSNVDKTWPKTKNCSKLYWYLESSKTLISGSICVFFIADSRLLFLTCVPLWNNIIKKFLYTRGTIPRKNIHSFGMHLFTHVQNHIIVDSPVCVNITIHSPVIALACYNVALAFRIQSFG